MLKQNSKPGRASAASLAVVPTLALASRPEPHRSLSAAESAHWRAIVQSLPADWFRPGDQPLLAAYCSACAQHEEATRQLAEQSLLLETGGRKYKNPLLTIQHAGAMLMATLATKLRLTQSSRYGARTADTAAKNAQTGKRPWQ